MKKSEAEKHFRKYRESLREELSKLATYVRLYRRLHERRTDRLKEMNLAPAVFFNDGRCALLSDCALG